ncbi:MAG: transporter substrate-binding domain-containing protein [Deltaproteobacteria bacterium]|nr:transporter substrate-binding domain-containing protein [Deltaproteobacteria bacterium]MBW2303814.1 transporter substrate-binding domain-containing protein [Deltaproteobacteria bacterium]
MARCPGILERFLPIVRILTPVLILLLSSFAHADKKPLIVVGDRSYAPMEFLDNEGKARGIMVDIWRLWSRKTGIPVDYRCMDWSDAINAVLTGRADVVADIFYSEKRARLFDFSPSFLTMSTSLFFHRNLYGIKGLEDLTGFQVGVVKGDYAQEFIETRYPNISTVPFSTYEEMVRGAGAACCEGNPGVNESVPIRILLVTVSGIYFINKSC